MDMTHQDMYEKIGEASSLLKSLANEARLKIVCQLVEKKELSVGALLETIPLSQSAMSQHLGILRREDIVSTRREAQTIYYSLASNEAGAVLDVLHELYCKQKR